MLMIKNLARTVGTVTAAVVLLASDLTLTMADDAQLRIGEAWARAPAVPGGNGAAYLTLINTGNRVRRLVAAESPASERAELHRTVESDGVVQMVPQDGIAVRAGGRIRLEPGGAHIMLIDAEASMSAGTRIPLTLHFANGATRRATADVVGPGRTPDMADGDSS